MSDYDKPLQVTDIINFQQGKQFQVRLRQSKTNQCGPPQLVHISAINTTSCPVKAMYNYLKIKPRNNNNNCLFCHADGSPLSRYQFGAVLSKVIRSLQLNEAIFKTHSFRIGAATWLAKQGFSDDTIKKMGRWTSDSFKKYIR